MKSFEPSELMRSLESVLGEDYVSDDITVRQCYSRDPHPSVTIRKLKRDPITVPDIVVLPADEAEVRAVLNLAQRYGYHAIAMSSGDNLIGPNYIGLVKMLKRVVDPTDTCNPDRLAFMQPPEKATAGKQLS